VARIGRNACCPCGSGHKHKSCCLPLLESAAREERALEGVFRGLADWISEECPRLYEEANEVTRFERLLGGSLQRRHYSLWAMIDYAPSDGGPPLAARYATRPDLPRAEQAHAERIAATKVDVHRVLDVVPGIWVELETLAGGETARTLSPLASTRTRAGDVLLTRLMSGPSSPSIWGAGTVFGADGVRKWAHHIDALPAGRADAALTLLSFDPADHAEPLPDAHDWVTVTWRVDDGELVLDALEEDPLFASLGQEISGGWAFAWLGARKPRAAVAPDDEDGEGGERARLVVDRELVTTHAIDQAVSNDLEAHLERDLKGLIEPADHHRRAA